MDHYDKTRSKLGNSVAAPEAGLAHVTGLEEHPTCDSDIYLGYLQATTREIINAIEGAGLTRDGTDLTQLFQAIEAIADNTFGKIVHITDNVIFNDVAIVVPVSPTNINLLSFGVPSNAKRVWINTQLRVTSESSGTSVNLRFTHKNSTVINRAVSSGRQWVNGVNMLLDVDLNKTIKYEVNDLATGSDKNYTLWMAVVAYV